MSAQGIPPVGDIPEVFQEDDEPFLPVAVAVTVDGPVQTHELPSVSGGMRGFSLTTAGGGRTKKIVGNDPRRRILRLWADQPFYIGGSAQEATPSYGPLVSANLVVPITHVDEVWVTMTADGYLSAIVENWAS